MKTSLIFDVDDVILDSCKAIVDIINERYELSPQATEEKNQDWDFTYLKRIVKKQRGIDLYTKDFLNLFEEEEFWNRVEFKKEFVDIISNKLIRDNYKIVIISSGTEKNLKMKQEFLFNHLNMQDIIFHGISLNLKRIDYGKEEINGFPFIFNSIQIDDKYECLNTYAKLKILLKNNKETDYNQVLDTREDLYIINDLNELKDLLIFISEENNEFFKDYETLIV